MNALPVRLAVAALLLACPAAGRAQSTPPRASSTPAPNWPFSNRATPAPLGAKAAPPAPSAALSGERAKLIEGVKSIPRIGSPGPVVAYGAQAFPLAITTEDKVAEAVAAAGLAGKGHAVIFGHTGYLGGESSEGDLDRLLLNAVRWCAGKEKPRIGVKGAKTAALLEKNGLHATSFDKVDQPTLRGFDVVIMSAQGLTDETEASVLREYLEGGGGWIGAVTGWAFGQTSGGKDFATANRGNDVLAGAALAFTSESLAGGVLEVPAQVSPMLNAATALAALAPKPGTAALSPAEIEQGTKTVALALSAMPAAGKPAFQQLIARSLTLENSPVPTPEKPLTESGDPALRARAALEARFAHLLAPADVKPNPAAEKFPGRVVTAARPISKTLAIDPNIPGWQSTGLYADAGARIGVKLPPECSGQGYAVRIGCHTDRLYKLEQWKRMPEITASTPLQAPETAAAGAFGGLVYIVVPDKAKQTSPFQVTISGAVESPLFVLDQTTDAQWEQIRQRPAPWAELACQGVILTVPGAIAREVHNPTELMRYWQHVVEAEDELANTAAQRRRPERIVPDVQISAGFMHSGYPIMVHVPQAQEMVTYNSRKWPGWGFYHELGHNHQKPEWTFDGTTEVTCNLFSLYIFEAVLGKDKTIGHPAVLPQAQAEHYEKHKKAGLAYTAWTADPFLALTCYLQLLDAFGFDTLKQVLRSYQGSDFGPAPETDDEKRDQWMIRYAKISGKNLGPFFDAWGIPVSAGAKAQIARLPPWMPPGMK